MTVVSSCHRPRTRWSTGPEEDASTGGGGCRPRGGGPVRTQRPRACHSARTVVWALVMAPRPVRLSWRACAQSLRVALLGSAPVSLRN